MSSVIIDQNVYSWINERPIDSHKGLFGHVVVAGGNLGMPGSVRLSGEGALRTGAGKATVFTRHAHVTSVVTGRPELMCYGVSWCLRKYVEVCSEATVIVIGPGLGQQWWSRRLFAQTMQANCSLVLDADALNLLAKKPFKSPKWILTPHPGEAAKLLGISVADVQSDRNGAIYKLQQRYGGVIILKGAKTLVLAENQEIHCCLAGNPGMASPGMGDLLSGIVAGFIAQGLTPWQAAQAGVFVHATAGDRAAEKIGQRGLLASDLLYTM